jgi:hypothetical protein
MPDDFLTIDEDGLKADLDHEIVQTLGPILPDTEQALVAAEQRLVGELVARIRAKASGEVLKQKTGRFAASIHGGVVDQVAQVGLGAELLANISVLERIKLDIASEQGGVFAKVGSDDPKAHILEYGAELPPHEIDPNIAHALRFLGHDGAAFAARVHFPGARLKPHSTIHAAFAEMQAEIFETLENAVNVV